MQVTGYGFIGLIILGVLFGELFLGTYAIQLAVPEATWDFCHLNNGFLLLHLNLLMAPLVSKTWRVWRKIKKAETRLLKLWDHSATKMTVVQLVACVCLFVAHMCVLWQDQHPHLRRRQCFEFSDEDVGLGVTSRFFYLGQVLLLLAHT